MADKSAEVLEMNGSLMFVAGHGPGEGLAVGVAGAAAVDREASQRVAPGRSLLSSVLGTGVSSTRY